MDAPESACMVIADISGYTDYLAGVELDHAQDILADLMNVVVAGLRPPFALAKLEGDAAFVFAPSAGIDGSAVQDVVESTYFAFRRRLRDIHHATTCECDACSLIPRLDLKFVAHAGVVARQIVADREELIGSDVILVHRLLKNTAGTKLNDHPYALYTDACVKALAIPAEAQGLVSHNEEVAIIGEVGVWLQDLETAWQLAESDRHGEITRGEALKTIFFELDAPRQIVWDYLTNPRHRPLWLKGVTEVLEQTKESRRRGAGTTNHCMHGNDVQLEEIMDWRPNEQMTARGTFPDPGLPNLVKTDILTDLPGARTRLEVRIEKPQLPGELPALEAVLPFFEKELKSGIEILAQLAKTEAERQKDNQKEGPRLPESTGRFISEPVEGRAHHIHEH